MQIYQHSFFSNLAQKQYQTSITYTPLRAPILDRNGTPIALNKSAVSAFITPSKIVMHNALQNFLELYFPQAYNRYQNRQQHAFMFLQRNISENQMNIIKSYDLDEIQFIKEPHRYYPFPTLAPIVGITNIDNTGILGIEYTFDTLLKGTESSYTLKKDARSHYFYFEKKYEHVGTDGQPITLTIDADLQFLITEELKQTIEKFNAKQGSIIVLDPITGDIIVMANYPGFDPNNTQQLDQSLTKNNCIAEQYELGSVIKVFAALAALEEGVVTIDEKIDCGNTKTTYVDGRKINTTVAHGVLSFSQVIEKSNNIGIALVAKRLNEKLYTHYLRAGFGSLTGIELPGEQKGFINPPQHWSKQSVISLSYGYEITATLLQLARAFSIIANNGCMVQPHIILHPNRTPHMSEPLYSPKTIDDIKEILNLTTLQGTAQKARMRGYDIMCKTGTANLLENGVYVASKNSYTCAGILKKNKYTRIIVVYIKQAETPGLFASQVAVPLFEKVAQKTIIHDKIV
jgi:cell division protein FtsI (penicillin-binding protein 3)